MFSSVTLKERTLNPIIETHNLVKYCNLQEVESRHFRNVYPRVRIHLQVELVNSPHGQVYFETQVCFQNFCLYLLEDYFQYLNKTLL
jgi:hypothetical protein